MSQPFFITGLPRSRLSWLANLLTWRSSFCYHGALAQCACISDLKQLLGSSPDGATQVGDADPLIGCVSKELLRDFPKAKFVFIFRPMAECMEEEMQAVAGMNISPLDLSRFLHVTSDGQDDLWALTTAEQKIWISFRDLENQAVVESIWRFCLPDLEFPIERYKMLDCLKVTKFCSKTLARFPHQPFRQMLNAKEKA